VVTINSAIMNFAEHTPRGHPSVRRIGSLSGGITLRAKGKPGKVMRLGCAEKVGEIIVRPRDVVIWRRVLGLTQGDAANLCGRSRHWIIDIEDGTTPIPRWLNYGMAFCRVFKPIQPYPDPDELAAKMVEVRGFYNLTQAELGDLLGLHRETVLLAEKGQPRPMGIGFAVAWIVLYGSRLPYPSLPSHLYLSGK